MAMRWILFLCCGVLLSGCRRHWAEQLEAELDGGLGACFVDGKLDGLATYGFDASFLHGRILRHVRERLPAYLKTPLKEFRRSSPLVYFLALKYEAGRHERAKCLRLQYGAIERRGSGEGTEDACEERPGRNRCFTFFMVTESNAVHVLCVDTSRNRCSSHWTLGRDFRYGSADFPIAIWDASLPDRNSPEVVLGQTYREVFAVMTERPFNYLAYQTVGRLDDIRQLVGTSIFRLRWKTPECLIFIPDYLCERLRRSQPQTIHLAVGRRRDNSSSCRPVDVAGLFVQTPRAEGGAGTLRSGPKEVEACCSGAERVGVVRREGRNLLRPWWARRGYGMYGSCADVATRRAPFGRGMVYYEENPTTNPFISPVRSVC